MQIMTQRDRVIFSVFLVAVFLASVLAIVCFVAVEKYKKSKAHHFSEPISTDGPDLSYVSKFQTNEPEVSYASNFQTNEPGLSYVSKSQINEPEVLNEAETNSNNLHKSLETMKTLIKSGTMNTKNDIRTFKQMLKNVFTIAATNVIYIKDGVSIEEEESLAVINDDQLLHAVVLYVYGTLYFLTNNEELLDTICKGSLIMCKLSKSTSVIEGISPFVIKTASDVLGRYKYKGDYGYFSSRFLYEEILYISDLQKNIYSQEIKLDSFASYLSLEEVKNPLMVDAIHRANWRDDKHLIQYDDHQMPRIAVFPVDVVGNVVLRKAGMMCDINKMISTQIINYIYTKGGMLGDLVISFTEDEEIDLANHNMFTINGVPFHKISGVMDEMLVLKILGMGSAEDPDNVSDIFGEIRNSKHGLLVAKIDFGNGYDIIPQISDLNLDCRKAKFIEGASCQPKIQYVVDLPLAEYCKACLEYQLQSRDNFKSFQRKSRDSFKDFRKKANGVIGKLDKLVKPSLSLSNAVYESIEGSELHLPL